VLTVRSDMEQPRTKAAGTELTCTGDGGSRRWARAGQDWCRARARAAADLLGRHEQPRTKAACTDGADDEF
jgi:hypothetical protein